MCLPYNEALSMYEGSNTRAGYLSVTKLFFPGFIEVMNKTFVAEAPSNATRMDWVLCLVQKSTEFDRCRVIFTWEIGGNLRHIQ